MIVAMKKLSVVLYHRQKNDFMNALRDLGVVHIEIDPEVSSDELREAGEWLRRARNTLTAVKRFAAGMPPPSPAAGREAGAVIEEYEELERRREKNDQEIQAVKKEIALLAPWGDFDPGSIGKLRERGITVRFFEMPVKKLAAFSRDDYACAVIDQSGSTARFIVFEKDGPVSLPADEVHLPDTSLAGARQRLRRLQREREETDGAIAGLAAYAGELERFIAAQTDRFNYEAASLNFSGRVEGKVNILRGWVPQDVENRVRTFLDTYVAWYSVENPVKGDSIPVLLKNNAFSKLFEPITRIFQLPNYHEIDPTPMIAPFFAIFFGTCLGDAGYGLVIIALSIAGLFTFFKKLKLIAYLGLTLGIATLVMGIVNTGLIFGIEFRNHLNIPLFGLLFKATIIKDTVMISPFNFALLLGVIQMTFGMVLNIYNNITFYSFKHALPGIGKILIVDSCIVLFLVLYQKMEALRFLLGFALGGVTLGVLILIYVAFFTDLDKYLDNAVANLVLKLYFVLSGAVGDILSYIRLFALGLSSGVLGYVVNVIGLQMKTIPVVGVFVFIIFVLFGHTINLVLSALSSFVHPLRLTFVEFYNNLEFKGGGFEYRPLRKTT